MGTAERRLQIMKQLCRQRYATMPELAEKYAVSVRTIQRDIFELTFLMPVYVKSGRHDGGIYVEESYHMDYKIIRCKKSMLYCRAENDTFRDSSTLYGCE